MAVASVGQWALLAGACAAAGSADTAQDPAGEGRKRSRSKVEWGTEARTDALRRAAFWIAPQPERRVPAGDDDAIFSCRFRAEAPGGTTAKFECDTASGERVKVKYSGAEPHGEVAATELLRALGFPADHVTFVERVRCYGCPPAPFLTAKVLGFVNALQVYERRADYGAYREFAWAAVERRHPGVAIETPEGRGWAWYELNDLASPRAHADALRLIAVLIAHWDNKSENQRLVCLDEDTDAVARETCARPLALLQDLGGTFGPRKVNLERWRASPVWADRASCLVSMEHLPHGGATFEPVRISEEGRQFAAERLASLPAARVRGIFERARFPQHDGHNVAEWVGAFEAKAAEISAGPPCPAP